MNKQQEKKRLFLYLGLTFLLSWSVFFLFIVSGGRFVNEDGTASQMASLVAMLGMLCPTIGMLLTRWMTKEGFACVGADSMRLGIRFSDRRWLFYIAAVFLPWIYMELGSGLRLALSPAAFSTEVLDKLGDTVYLQPAAAIVSGVVISFAALGEELGWRGYMMPKLLELMDVKWAILVGGAIWGIWHWPMTYIGHNFGMEYWGYPFTGFAAMCILAIAMGTILTYLTYKTGSIWSAAILHAVTNATPGILKYFIDTEKLSGWMQDSVVVFLISFLPLFVIAIGVYISLCREYKKNKTF